MTTKPYAGIKVDPGRLRALEGLHMQLRTAIDTGGQIPCCSADRDLWVSEDRAEQTEAADRCTDCPLMLGACTDYITAWPEPTSVWAGRLPTERTSND